MMRSLTFAAALFACLLAFPAGAVAVRTAHVEAELVAEKAALAPGRPLTVALRLKMEPGWHTYWQNPGESGLPTTIAWKLPASITAGPIQWPAPRALPVGPLVNYGYEGEILLLSEIVTPPDSVGGGAITLDARADWLVCKEICIPEGADLSLPLPVAADAAPDPRWTEPIAKARAALPKPLEGWRVSATGRGPSVDLSLTPPASSGGASDPGEVRFFPYAEGKIEASAAQTLSRDGPTIRLTLPVASQRVGEFTRVAGVLTSSRGFGTERAVTIDVPLAGTVVAGAPPPRPSAPSLAPMLGGNGANSLTLAVALLFALAGGVLLNLMPCVFPVLSLKVLGFAMHRDSRAAMRTHGFAFAAGVIASFWALAAALLALRAAGGELGWGFQLQSPAVVAALAILFFVLALNLSGLFEVGQLLPSGLATWKAKNAYVTDLWSGVVAVVIASPCTAPFMGAALGYALTESATVTLAVFTALGLGMALPYLLLALLPGWRSKLPKPGAWMVRVKQLLAFPLYATVIWLGWVLGAQLDNDAVARLFAVLLLVALALWAWQTVQSGGARAWRTVAVAIAACAIGAAWPLFGPAEPARPKIAVNEGAWRAYSPARLAELSAGGTPVFVEFTAAWCVTCQVNKRLVLNNDAAQEAFARKGVALLRADWTRRDPAITEALAMLGRNGVPVYVLYRPGKEPLLLPEVLRRQIVLDALATL